MVILFMEKNVGTIEKQNIDTVGDYYNYLCSYKYDEIVIAYAMFLALKDTNAYDEIKPKTEIINDYYIKGMLNDAVSRTNAYIYDEIIDKRFEDILNSCAKKVNENKNIRKGNPFISFLLMCLAHSIAIIFAPFIILIIWKVLGVFGHDIDETIRNAVIELFGEIIKNN